ncbi:ABC transporter permease [Phytohabitans sp. ZYX-F-186]|uniref:ABC transporter permease n=1 Tax=Phytohabitans maris TaxID=3071409 RepID=A0ABU0ZRE5_9ACTN|nr:ABC transporter permease [Phytohabitans sp. ZYX-F-186]MDQ7908810.1 ABC transporter permease [Phytohabitans sp. ZYX-F-186]
MNTATVEAPVRTPTHVEVGRPSIGRLTLVELRKMTDTRAGFWLLALTALGYAALVTVVLFAADPPDRTFYGFFQITLLPSGVLLPVIGILAVTGEWTQRGALTTFTLVPERERVAAAKLLAGVVLAAASVVAGLFFAALGNLAGIAFADGDGSWQLTVGALGSAALFQVVNITMGVAFGMLLMNSPLAIVLYFLLPTVWSVLTSLVGALKTPAQWLDLSVTSMPLTENAMAGSDWAKLAASVGLWVVVPLAAGLVRLLRREVS